LAQRGVIVSAILIAVAAAAGLAIRFAHLGLPFAVTKYGGSALWALMIYWIVSTVAGRWSPIRSGLTAGVIAVAVECLKLYRTPALDAFRHTLAGIILLGRVFSIADLVVYGLAIVCGVVIDQMIRTGRRGGRG